MVFDPNVFDSDVFDAGSSTNAPAGHASGTGSAFNASISLAPNGALSSGAGAANNAAASLASSGGAASGSGSAGGNSSSVATTPTAASGSGSAYDATVQTGTFTNAVAQLASGTGAANNTSINLASSASAGTGSGAAGGSASNVKVTPSAAAGTGAANNATVSTASSTTNAPAGHASGTGTAYGTSRSAAAGLAWGYGTAYDVADTGLANAEVATGTGEAFGAFPIDFGDALPEPEAAEPIATIKYDGIDITADVMFSLARFTSAANGSAGSAELRVRDDGHTYKFVTGRRLDLYIEDVLVWAGFVASVRRGFWTRGGLGGADRERYFEIQGIDVNILFQRRFLFDQDNPTRVQLATFPAGTPDDEVVLRYVRNFLTLQGDGVGTGMVEHVGTPSRDTEISGASGWSWKDFMDMIIRNTGALYYLNPDRDLVLTDVDVPNAPFTLSDNPGLSVPSELTTTDNFDRTVGSGWGTGTLGTWSTEGGGTLSVDGAEALATGSAFVYQTVPLSLEAIEADTREVTMRFKLGTSGSDTVGFEIIDPLGSEYLAVYFVFSPSIADTLDINTTGESESVEVVGFNRSLYGFLRIDLNRTTGVVRGKVWNDGDTEPDWQLEVTDATLIENDDLTTLAVARDASSATTARFGWVTIVHPTLIESGEVGYRDLEIHSDGGKLRNDAMIWGAGQGSNMVRFSRVRSGSSIEEHGLWQTAEFNQAMWRQSTVNRVARTQVYGSPQSKRGGKDDAIGLRCTVFENGLRVGQKVSFRSEVFDYADVVPIRAMTVDFPTPTTARYDLTLGHEVDVPWSTFEFWMPSITIDPIDIGDFGGIDIGDLGGIDITGPGGLGGFGECEDTTDCVVNDSFDRTEPSSFGISDSGHAWGDPIGITITRTSSIDGEEGLLHDEPGFVGTSSFPGTINSAAKGFDLDGEGELFVPIGGTFRFRFTGTWSSTYPYNPSDAGDYYAPGFASSGTSTALGGGSGWNRAYLDVRTRNSIPHHHFRVYNSNGGLYVANYIESSVAADQYLPVLVGSALEEDRYLNVQVFLDSDRAYMRVWKEGAPKPGFWHVQTVATAGSTWGGSGDNLWDIISVGSARGANQAPFALWVEDLCIGRFSSVGAAMGLFTESTEIDTFNRTEASGLGTSDPAAIVWTGDDTEGSVDGTHAVWDTADQTFHSLEDIDIDFSVDPVMLEMRVRHEGVVGNGGISLGLTSADFGTYGEVQFGLQPGLVPELICAAQLEFGTPVIDSEYNVGTHGVDNIVRVEFATNGVNAKVWAATDPEPEDWQVTAIESLTPLLTGNWLYLLVQPGSAFNVISVDYIASVVENDPCGPDIEGDTEDVPGGGNQHELDPIDTPPGEDGSSTWFRVANYFRQESVYLNGDLLRRNVDYIPHYADLWIEILSSITVLPSDSVYATYTVYMPGPEEVE